jgi:hypothetical protein
MKPPAFCRSATAHSADLDHVITIGADSLSAFSAGIACFFRREFMSSAFLMRGNSTQSGDGPLFHSFH